MVNVRRTLCYLHTGHSPREVRRCVAKRHVSDEFETKLSCMHQFLQGLKIGEVRGKKSGHIKLRFNVNHFCYFFLRFCLVSLVVTELYVCYQLGGAGKGWV